MKKVWKVVRVPFILLAVLFLAAFIFVCVLIAQAPDLDQVSAEPDGYLTTVLDDQDNVMTTLAGSEANRIHVSLDQIPEQLQDAFIATEDARFYQHHGIDLKGIARAFVKGVKTGKFSEGASTITQQVLKNNVLTSWVNEETFYQKVCRKIQEQYLALKLERMYSKEEILEDYLNTINLGSGTWGVEAASKRYFGKDVSELDLTQCAVLAGITKSPTTYNPITNPEKSKERTKLVLSNLLQQGYVTETEYNEALSNLDSVYEEIAGNHSDSSAQIFSYFEDELVEAVMEDLQTAGYSEEDAWNMIYRGGLTIKSTQDSRIQSICEEVINNDDLYSNDAQASIVVTDVETGAVKAIVGGRGKKEASLTYNRASESLRQPGSTIKVIGQYAAALDTGVMTLGTCVDDAPVSYLNGNSVNNSNGEYAGMTTIRTAITNSVNTVALKTFREVGMETVYQYLTAFGITTLTNDDKIEALALGGTSGGVTNLEMTAAYNAIANGGIYTKPYYYTQVLDHDGSVLLENTPVTSRAVSETTATLLTSAMEDVLTEGTGTAAYFSGTPLAGKTGTTNDLKDLWMIGFSPEYTCGVWGGYDNPTAQDSGLYVKKIWKSVMSQINDGSGNSGFELADGLVRETICTKCGLLARDGICDNTLSGDETEEELFAEGTEPSGYCDCHVEVTICSTSGEPAGAYCPADCCETKIYLREASAGTTDENYVWTGENSGTCTVHNSFWDSLFGENGPFNWGSGMDGDDGSYGNDGNSDGNDSGDSDGGWFDWDQVFGW